MKNKFFILILLLLNIIFIGTANAENNNGQIIYNNPYVSSPNATLGSLIQQDNTRYFDFTPKNQYSNVRVNFDAVTIPKNTDYFIIPFSILDKTRDKYFSCSGEYTASNELTQFDLTTYYHDGTTAQIQGSATTDGLFKYCEQFRTGNDKYTINVSFNYTDNVGVNCNVIGNDKVMYAQCPITSGRSDGTRQIKNFVFNFSTSETSNFKTYNIRIPNNTFLLKLDSNAEMIEKQNETNNKLNQIDTSINSSNTSGGESAADDLKNNSAFQDNSGLSSVVSMPLTFVNSLSNTCQPITLNIPYFDVDMQIPCLQSIITEKMPALANILKVVINGFIIYRVLLDIFQIIRNAKNPEDDRIEVLDL